MLLLLCDLLECNDHISLASFKTPMFPHPMAKLVSCRTTCDLANLIVRKGFHYPFTFERALALVLAHGNDPAECLCLGVQSFKWFPSIVFWDEARNPKVKWDKRSFIELYPPQTPRGGSARGQRLRDD